MSEGIGVVNLAHVLKLFGDFIGWLIDLFGGGPAGSGGVFRKAAVDTIAESDKLRIKANPEMWRIAHDEIEYYWKGMQMYVAELRKFHNLQSDNFVQFEGSNLLGATFFDSWTNTILIRDHYGPMIELNAAVGMDTQLKMLREVQRLDGRINAIEGGTDVQDQIADLQQRISDIETFKSPAMQLIKHRLDGLTDEYDLLSERLGKIEEGLIGETDPETEERLQKIVRDITTLQNQMKLLPIGWTSEILKKRFEQIATNIAGLRTTLQSLQKQLQAFNIPGMKQDIATLKQQVLVLPGLQREIQETQQRLDKLEQTTLPALKRELQGQIDPLKQRVTRLENRLDYFAFTYLPALSTDLYEWIDSWDERKEGTVNDACECARVHLPDWLPTYLNCLTVLSMLCTCSHYPNPELDSLWECIRRKIQEPKPEPPPEEHPGVILPEENPIVYESEE